MKINIFDNNNLFGMRINDILNLENYSTSIQRLKLFISTCTGSWSLDSGKHKNYEGKENDGEMGPENPFTAMTSFEFRIQVSISQRKQVESWFQLSTSTSLSEFLDPLGWNMNLRTWFCMRIVSLVQLEGWHLGSLWTNKWSLCVFNHTFEQSLVLRISIPIRGLVMISQHCAARNSMVSNRETYEPDCSSPVFFLTIPRSMKSARRNDMLG